MPSNNNKKKKQRLRKWLLEWIASLLFCNSGNWSRAFLAYSGECLGSFCLDSHVGPQLWKFKLISALKKGSELAYPLTNPLKLAEWGQEAPAFWGTWVWIDECSDQSTEVQYGESVALRNREESSSPPLLLSFPIIGLKFWKE